MSYLPQYKFGDCSQCDATNTNVVKVKKDLFCVSCHQKNKALEQIEKQKKKNALKRDSGKVRSIAIDVDSGNKEMAYKHKSKSDLLKQADKVFGDWIKNRDTKGGKITCVCCKDEYFADAVNGDGKKIIQPLHFVGRGVYDLRFDADNVHAGCCYCNLKQHLNPKGLEYQRYRKFLIDKIGLTAVEEMELVKRKINKIEESQLRTVIEHYSN